MDSIRFPVGWFEIYVQDMERAKAFYQKTFKIKLSLIENAIPEMWAFPLLAEDHGCPGALVKMSGKDSGIGGTIVYFSCVNCAREAARASKNGGRIHREKFAVGKHGFISLVLDTEGNLIGLHSMQ